MDTKIRKAHLKDVNAIYRILSFYAKKGVILLRTKEDIADSIDHFLVAEHDGKLTGIAAYYDYGKHLKEIRSLAVLKKYSKKGTGSILVKSLVKRLRNVEHPPKIFALSYSPEFFKKLGFVEVDKEKFPEKIWKDCNNCKDRDHCGETALVYSV